MPREKENYRDMLARLDEIFPTQEMLTLNGTIKFLGVSNDTAKKMFSFKKSGNTYYISKSTLARELC